MWCCPGPSPRIGLDLVGKAAPFDPVAGLVRRGLIGLSGGLQLGFSPAFCGCFTAPPSTWPPPPRRRWWRTGCRPAGGRLGNLRRFLDGGHDSQPRPRHGACSTRIVSAALSGRRRLGGPGLAVLPADPSFRGGGAFRWDGARPQAMAGDAGGPVFPFPGGAGDRVRRRHLLYFALCRRAGESRNGRGIFCRLCPGPGPVPDGVWKNL